MTDRISSPKHLPEGLHKLAYIIITRLKLLSANIVLLAFVLFLFRERRVGELKLYIFLGIADFLLMLWWWTEYKKQLRRLSGTSHPLETLWERLKDGAKDWRSAEDRWSMLVQLAFQWTFALRIQPFLLALAALYQTVLLLVSSHLRGAASSEGGLAASLYRVWLVVSLNSEGVQFPGHKTALVFFFVLLVYFLVCTFIYATKKRLDKRIPHHRVQDKFHSLSLKDHIVIFGDSESCRIVLEEISRRVVDRQIVLVSRELSRDDYAGLTRIASNLWAMKGLAMDPEVLALADIKDAKQVVFLSDPPTACQRLERLDGIRTRLMLPHEILLTSVLAVESTNPNVQCLVETDAGHEEGKVLKDMVSGNDVVVPLEDLKQGIEKKMAEAPRSMELLYDLLSVRNLFGFRQRNNCIVRLQRCAPKGDGLPILPPQTSQAREGHFWLPLGIVARQKESPGRYRFYPNLPHTAYTRPTPTGPVAKKTPTAAEQDVISTALPAWSDAFWVLVGHDGSGAFRQEPWKESVESEKTLYLASKEEPGIKGPELVPSAERTSDVEAIVKCIRSQTERRKAKNEGPYTPNAKSTALLVRHPWLERHVYSRLARIELGREDIWKSGAIDDCRFWQEVNIGCPAHLSALLIARCIVEEEPFHLVPKILGLLPGTYAPDGYTIEIRKYTLNVNGEYSPDSLLRYFAERSEIPIAIERQRGRLVVGPALFDQKHWVSGTNDKELAKALYVFHMKAPAARREG